jgi:hypothetical protein
MINDQRPRATPQPASTTLQDSLQRFILRLEAQHN